MMKKLHAGKYQMGNYALQKEGRKWHLFDLATGEPVYLGRYFPTRGDGEYYIRQLMATAITAPAPNTIRKRGIR